MPERDLHVLIAYDGSTGADRALEHAARLFAGARATVLTCWSSAHDAARAARTVMSDATIALAVENLDEATRARAAETAAEGARRARAAGLRADPAERCAGGAIWGAIIELALEAGADVVVIGSRGHSELRSVVLGSTSHGVVHHCTAPVLVVGAARPDEKEPS